MCCFLNQNWIFYFKVHDIYYLNFNRFAILFLYCSSHSLFLIIYDYFNLRFAFVHYANMMIYAKMAYYVGCVYHYYFILLIYCFIPLWLYVNIVYLFCFCFLKIVVHLKYFWYWCFDFHKNFIKFVFSFRSLMIF